MAMVEWVTDFLENDKINVEYRTLAFNKIIDINEDSDMILMERDIQASPHDLIISISELAEDGWFHRTLCSHYCIKTTFLKSKICSRWKLFESGFIRNRTMQAH